MWQQFDEGLSSCRLHTGLHFPILLELLICHLILFHHVLTKYGRRELTRNTTCVKQVARGRCHVGRPADWVLVNDFVTLEEHFGDLDGAQTALNFEELLGEVAVGRVVELLAAERGQRGGNICVQVILKSVQQSMRVTHITKDGAPQIILRLVESTQQV